HLTRSTPPPSPRPPTAHGALRTGRDPSAGLDLWGGKPGMIASLTPTAPTQFLDTSGTSTASSAGSPTSSTSNRTTPLRPRDCLQRLRPWDETRRGNLPGRRCCPGLPRSCRWPGIVPAVLRGGGPVALVRRLPGSV